MRYGSEVGTDIRLPEVGAGDEGEGIIKYANISCPTPESVVAFRLALRPTSFPSLPHPIPSNKSSKDQLRAALATPLSLGSSMTIRAVAASSFTSLAVVSAVPSIMFGDNSVGQGHPLSTTDLHDRFFHPNFHGITQSCNAFRFRGPVVQSLASPHDFRQAPN